VPFVPESSGWAKEEGGGDHGCDKRQAEEKEWVALEGRTVPCRYGI
jgi:hypothetical protein